MGSRFVQSGLRTVLTTLQSVVKCKGENGICITIMRIIVGVLHISLMVHTFRAKDLQGRSPWDNAVN